VGPLLLLVIKLPSLFLMFIPRGLVNPRALICTVLTFLILINAILGFGDDDCQQLILGGCLADHCTMKDSRKRGCEMCKSGYWLQRGACQPCQKPCLECRSASLCISCQTSYILIDGLCTNHREGKVSSSNNQTTQEEDLGSNPSGNSDLGSKPPETNSSNPSNKTESGNTEGPHDHNSKAGGKSGNPHAKAGDGLSDSAIIFISCGAGLLLLSGCVAYWFLKKKCCPFTNPQKQISPAPQPRSNMQGNLVRIQNHARLGDVIAYQQEHCPSTQRQFLEKNNRYPSKNLAGQAAGQTAIRNQRSVSVGPVQGVSRRLDFIAKREERKYIRNILSRGPPIQSIKQFGAKPKPEP
jgi:hypothetical protein